MIFNYYNHNFMALLIKNNNIHNNRGNNKKILRISNIQVEKKMHFLMMIPFITNNHLNPKSRRLKTVLETLFFHRIIRKICKKIIISNILIIKSGIIII
jgi:hypothetical protein